MMYLRLPDVVQFGILVGFAALFFAAPIAHSLFWENHPYGTPWITTTFLSTIIFVRLIGHSTTAVAWATYLGLHPTRSGQRPPMFVVGLTGFFNDQGMLRYAAGGRHSMRRLPLHSRQFPGAGYWPSAGCLGQP